MSPKNTNSKRIWAGRILTAIPVLFLLFDMTGKFLKPTPVIEGTVQLGYPESVLSGLGLTLLISVGLHLFPRTNVLGAIILTGYLGGAVATHVRVGNPWATHILFPVYLGIMLWGGLYLRDTRVSAILPLKK